MIPTNTPPTGSRLIHALVAAQRIEDEGLSGLKWREIAAHLGCTPRALRYYRTTAKEYFDSLWMKISFVEPKNRNNHIHLKAMIGFIRVSFGDYIQSLSVRLRDKFTKDSQVNDITSVSLETPLGPCGLQMKISSKETLMRGASTGSPENSQPANTVQKMAPDAVMILKMQRERRVREAIKNGTYDGKNSRL